jgi:hypothetical protein
MQEAPQPTSDGRDPLAIRLVNDLLVLQGPSTDAKEGVAAFLGKRRPQFTMSVAKELPDRFPNWTPPEFRYELAARPGTSVGRIELRRVGAFATGAGHGVTNTAANDRDSDEDEQRSTPEREPAAV